MADSKPEAPPAKPPELVAPAIPSVLSNDHSLGKIMAMAREARGFSREQAATASHIPGYYLTMIESDDYSSIADQLYLLPFLRRYATFVALEPEEVASRFIRDVQRADMNPARMSEPIVMIADRKPFPWGNVMVGSAAVLVIGIAWLTYRHFSNRQSAIASSSQPVAAQKVVPEAAHVAPAKAAPALRRVAPAPVPLSAASRASTQKSAAHPVTEPDESSPTSGEASTSSAGRPRVPVKPH